MTYTKCFYIIITGDHVCSEGFWKCPRNETGHIKCIRTEYLCNGNVDSGPGMNYDCGNGDDEAVNVCSKLKI